MKLYESIKGMLFAVLLVAGGVLFFGTMLASEQGQQDPDVIRFRTEILVPFIKKLIDQNKTDTTTSVQQVRLLNLVVAIEKGLADLSDDARNELFNGNSAAAKYFRTLLVNIAFEDGWILPYGGQTPSGDKVVECWKVGEEAKVCEDFGIYFDPFMWMDTTTQDAAALKDFDTFKENVATLLGASTQCWNDTINMINSDAQLSSPEKAYYLQIMLRGSLRFYADVIAKQKEANLGWTGRGVRLAKDTLNFIRGRLPDHFIESAGRALYFLKGDVNHVYYYEFVDVIDNSLREFLTGTLDQKEINNHVANLKNKATRHWIFKHAGKIFTVLTGGVVGGAGMLSAYQIGWKALVSLYKAKGALAVLSSISTKTLTNIYNIPAGTWVYAQYVGGKLVGFKTSVSNFVKSYLPASIKTKFGIAVPKEGYITRFGKYLRSQYIPAWGPEVPKASWYQRAYQGAKGYFQRAPKPQPGLIERATGYFRQPQPGYLGRARTAVSGAYQRYAPTRETVFKTVAGAGLIGTAGYGLSKVLPRQQIPEGLEGVEITPSETEQATIVPEGTVEGTVEEFQ